jgi:hypothetical protein
MIFTLGQSRDPSAKPYVGSVGWINHYVLRWAPFKLARVVEDGRTVALRLFSNAYVGWR